MVSFSLLAATAKGTLSKRKIRCHKEVKQSNRKQATIFAVAKSFPAGIFKFKDNLAKFLGSSSPFPEPQNST
jgi:hypothetical protein